METEAQVKQGPDIQKLLAIQRIDREIAEIRRKQDEIPGEITRISSLLKTHEDQLHAVEKELMQAKKSQHESEVEIKQKEEQINKYQVQLHSIRTNREYEALLHEIKGLRADISNIEDLGLEQLARIEELEEQRMTATGSLNQEKATVAQKTSELEAQLIELKAKLEEKEKEKEPFSGQVDSVLLQRYRVLTENKRDSAALAELINDSCTGCNQKQTAQTVNEVMLARKFIFCPSCGRILYCAADYS